MRAALAGGGRHGRRALLPRDVPGCLLWLRADLGVTIGTGVATWADQSGNGHNATQATGSKQPIRNATDADFAGLPSLHGDGVDDYMDVALDLTGVASVTVLMAVRATAPAPTDQRGVFCVFTSDAAAISTAVVTIAAVQRLGQITYNSDVRGTEVDISTGAHIISATHISGNGLGFSLKVDGVAQALSNIGGNAPANHPFGTTCRLWDLFGGIACAPLKIAEVVVYGPTAAATAITRAETYLRARYGTA